MRTTIDRTCSIVALLLTAVLALSAAGVASAKPYAHACSHRIGRGVAACTAIRLLHPSTDWHGSHLQGQRTAPGKGPGEHPHKGKEEPKEEPVEEPKEEPGIPAGYGPAELRSAYGLTSLGLTGGEGETVAIVDAYDDPNAETDLNAYRAQYGLGECTEATGCFAKVNQEGGRSYPKASSSWGQEISLDLDMVSAICQGCHILLVEASSASFEDLGAAEDFAASHADAISNSYGGKELSQERSYDAYYDHPGVAITASAGDSGYGAEYPAASPFVTAVGGTTLKTASNERGWSESVWSGTGAGCSAIEPNPGWQPVTLSCANRTVADVSADANPSTGVAVYDTYGSSGWLVFGGTSVASPIAASIYALAGNTQSFETGANGSDAAQELYSAPLNRVSEGYDINRHRCGSYLCGAPYSLQSWGDALGGELTGWYNGPTGPGTPNGIAGF